MKKRTILSTCIVLIFCLSFTTSAMESDEDDVLQVAEDWNKAVNTGDLELMSYLYWNSPKTSSFTPWEAAAFKLQGYDAIHNWMKSTFESLEGNVGRTYHNSQVTFLENNVAILTCYEIITSRSPAGGEQMIDQNRQTLVVQKIGGRWLIVHDHGSLLPTE